MSLLGKLAKVLLYLPDDSIWALIREIYLLEAYPGHPNY
jgi:hypothetical protein